MTDFDQIVMPARPFALAWLAVCLAAGSDKDRPALYRRVNIGVHDEGLVLAATDGYWLARGWVPFDGDSDDHPAPELDEVVPAAFTVADVEHRIRDLMRYVERRTRKADDDDITPDLTVAITRFRDVDEDVPPLDPTLAAPTVLVELPGEERITARESEIEYPAIGKVARFQPQPTDDVLFSPRLMGLVTTAVQRFGAPALRMTATTQGSIAWRAAGCPGRVLHGVLMPLRDDVSEADA